jgi:hypothetical protein
MNTWGVAVYLVLAAVSAPVGGNAATGPTIENQYLSLTPAPGGAVATGLSLKSVAGNQAGPGGLFQEGFGIPSPYIPNRRINEKSQVTGNIWQCSYGCEGPNIDGIEVVRTIEPIKDEASLRVKWRIENKGKQSQWMAPWIRNSVQPAGTPDAADRIDLPTFDGIIAAKSTGYHALTRNWMAATDPNAMVSVCAVFNCDHAHSGLAIRDMSGAQCAFQAALLPKMLQPGDVFETNYRLNVLRGLKRVDFASQEIAAQVDYAQGKLLVMIATVKPLQEVQIHASILAENGRRWKLTPKKFSTDPNRVIRCTFEWTAPGAGAYDFLAQLQDQKGNPIDLNSELAPPHGGIDTQFVVGNPKTRRQMEAWTDAPHGLDRGTRKRTAAVAKLGDADAWIENALEKVYPRDIPEPIPNAPFRVQLSMARNERESFQIVLRPGKRQLANINCRCSDLICPQTSARIASANVKAFNVGNYPVTIPSHYEGPTGPTPDILRPFKNFSADENTATPIWFTAYASPKTTPGLYQGDITITAAGTAQLRVPIELRVHDFELPTTPALKTDFYFWPENAVTAARAMKMTLTSEELVQRYVLDALDHRITLRAPNLLPNPVSADALEKMSGRLDYLIGRGLTTVAVPATLLDTPEQLRLVDEFFSRKNLKCAAFCPMADTPAPERWQTLVERLNAWRNTAPHIPATVTTYGLQPFLNDAAEIWNVHSQIFDTTNNSPVLDRIKQGKEVWWFLAQGPARPYANFLIDFAGIEHRAFFWQTWALGIKGVHYWGVNFARPGIDPYVDQLDATPVNGDGCLLYPGPDGPVDSIRWEIIRDGIEDYDYLTIFTERLQKARQLLGKDPLVERAASAFDLKALVPDLVSFSRDSNLMYTKREEIARMIVELARATS